MAETNKLGLPLLEAAQAQKHVTVNEAFSRLDALTHLSLRSVEAVTPPVAAAEGDVHAVGVGATGQWMGQEGRLAVFLNNGWDFVEPKAGWEGWSEAEGVRVTFDGVGWVEGAGAMSSSGAGFVHRTVEVDHAIGAGATSVVSGLIPSDAIVYGVTGRVLAAIGGAGSFEIGVVGSSNRYGSGFGVASGSWMRGLTGSPMAYYGETDVILTALGGAFDGSGSVRLAVHFAELTLPRA